MFGVPVITLISLCSPTPQATVLVRSKFVRVVVSRENQLYEGVVWNDYISTVDVCRQEVLTLTNVCLSMITVFPVRCPLINSVCPQRVYKRRVSIKASYWQYTDTCKTSFRAQPPILPPVTAFGNPCCAGSCLCKGALTDLSLHRLSLTKLQAMTGQDL